MPATQVASVSNFDFGAPAESAPVLLFRVRADQGGKQALRFENTEEYPYEVTAQVSADGVTWAPANISDGPVPPVAATLSASFLDPEADLAFTAVDPGADGNDITIEFVDPAGNDQPLAVNVTGDAIEVSLETDSSGDPISTADDVITAIEASAPASALVTVVALGGGTGVVEDFGPTNLADGADATTGPTPTVAVPAKQHRNAEVLIRAGIDRFFRIVASGSARGQMQIRSDAILDIVRI